MEEVESSTEAVITTDYSDIDEDYEDYGVWDDYFDEIPIRNNTITTTTTPKPVQSIKEKKGILTKTILLYF